MTATLVATQPKPVAMDAAAADETLMLAYGERADLAAFEELYRRYRTPVYSYLSRHMPAATADEVFQETWAALIGYRHTYAPIGPFRSWLFNIAHNKMIDQFRQKRPQYLEEVGDSESRELQTSTDPHQQLGRQRSQEAMQRQIAALPFLQREALLLKQQGFSLEEIAAITNSQFETVKSRLRYAFQQLRATWEGPHED